MALELLSACGVTVRYGDCQTAGPSVLVSACSLHVRAGRQPSGPKATAGSG